MQRSNHRTLFTVFSLMLSTVLLAALAIANRPADAQSSLTDLGVTSSSPNPGVTGINDAGQIVGAFDVANAASSQAYLLQNGTLTNLGVPISIAYGINAAGDIAGVNAYRATLWQNGMPTDLGTLPGALYGSVALAINDNGSIVGASSTSFEYGGHAFLWQNGVITDLEALVPGDFAQSAAVSINNSGKIVGWSNYRNVDAAPSHAVLWQNGSIIDLGTLGGENSQATDINNNGQVVGWSETSTRALHAFLWQAGIGMTDLGTLDRDHSQAWSINDNGQVVGLAATGPLGQWHAFLWQNGVMTDLAVGGSYSLARDINNNGQIVGVRQMSDSRWQGFLLTLDGPPANTGSISGRVTDPDAAPVSVAVVQACPSAGGACALASTDAAGQYTASNLADGDYMLTAFPPAFPHLEPRTIGPVTIAGGAVVTGQDIQLAAIQPLPAATSITPSTIGSSGIPELSPASPLELVTQGCAGGSASYEVRQYIYVISSGAMAEGPAGTYSASIPPAAPYRSYAKITITINCPAGNLEIYQSTVLYIDPSGTVRTIDGAPIAGATVTLLRAGNVNGPFTPVPDGSLIMSPANRANPDTTTADGHFGWDVIAGFYKVRAAKAGCSAPDNPTQPYVESAMLTIPPPVTDLDLRLTCETDPPTITIATPANDARYLLHQAVAADYSCADEEAGVASCSGPVPSGANVDTNTPGDKTFTVTATDQVGNHSSASATYKVQYDFSGFFAPTANLPAINVMQAGRAIPVQFSLHGNQGLGILAAGYPTSQRIACDASTQVDDSAATFAATASGLSYDAGTDQYSYIWKTDKAWAGTCRQLIVRLIDGTEHRANFMFKR